MNLQYSFLINGKKLYFFSTRYTVHHENEYSLSYNGYVLMAVDKTEVETAIKSLTESNCYNGINILDAMAEADKKEAEKQKQATIYWNKVHDICIENENRLKAKTEEIKQYFNDVLSKQYTTGNIVYNKLEDCIKQGYFIIYTGFSNWKHIQLSDTPIKPLELLNTRI